MAGLAPLGVDDPGAEMVVEGPVVSPQKPEDAPAARVADRGRSSTGPPAVTDELVERLNLPDEQANQAPADPPPDDPPPLVGPPLYGSHHAQQPRIETEEPAASSSRSGSASSTSTRATGSSAASAPGSCRPSRKT